MEDFEKKNAAEANDRASELEKEIKPIEPEDNLLREEEIMTEPTEKKEEMKLDDARRVKAVSPGMLVAKRFFRNKLAMVGLSILIILFLFCFLGSALYPYSEKDIFTTYKTIMFDYSFARISTEYVPIASDKAQPSSSLINMLNSHIIQMKSENLTEKNVVDDGKNYILKKLKDDIYLLEFNDDTAVAQLATTIAVGTYSANKARLTLNLNTPDQDLSEAIEQDWVDSGKVKNFYTTYKGNRYTLKGGKILCSYSALQEVASTRQEGITDAIIDEAKTKLGGTFTANGTTYKVTAYAEGDESGYYVTTRVHYIPLVTTTLSLDKYTVSDTISKEFNFKAIYALGLYNKDDASTKTFTADDKTYAIVETDGGVKIQYASGEKMVDYVAPSAYSIRRYSGEDTISISTKAEMRKVMDTMLKDGLKLNTVTITMEALDENGDYVYNEDGTVSAAEELFEVKSQEKGSGQQFVFRNNQSKLVADIHADPSKEHILGLDGNAMDVLARIMYGGRISLLIGFIVVIIEIILGSIMGGISGYFGGIIDNIIMRIVDIFYCIPTMPILIILGAVFDQMKLPNLERIIWMMAVLGFLGWPSIARLVRGQILSLREQDFMIAAEASGLKSSRKIAKHLIPNVIPQLIVQATMGLGSVIITESTLSFLGLGVKFPMATWGQIINSVSSITDMVKYTYIWIPVGGLICLAVIAFNFVGDGLRDAFDPKMSR